MNNFLGGNRGGRGGGGGRDRGGRGGFRPGGKPGFGGGRDRDSRPQVMHPATCSGCGKSCEVPFRPTGEKPVFCRDCFTAQGGSQGGDRGDRNDRFDRKPRRDFSSNDRPARSAPQNSGSNDELKKQLELLNSKLEILISAVKALAPAPAKAPTVKAPTVKPEETIVAEKTTAKKTTKKAAKKSGK